MFQLPLISGNASKEEPCKPCFEPCKPSQNRHVSKASTSASMASMRTYSVSSTEDDFRSSSESLDESYVSTTATLKSIPRTVGTSTSIPSVSTPRSSIDKEDRPRQACPIPSPAGQAPIGFKRKVRHSTATQAAQPSIDGIISVSDLHSAIRDVAITIEVAYVCSHEQAENVPMSYSIVTFSDKGPHKFPERLTSAFATIFIVEDNEECVDRAGLILRTESGSMAGSVSVLLIGERAITDHTYVVEMVSLLMKAGADDVAIVPQHSIQLRCVISASIGKAEFCRQQREHLERKVSASRKQCHRLFWESAHEILEGVPQVRQNCREVRGKRIGNMDLIGKVGEGAFCEVYQCRESGKDKTCVVKIYKKHEINSLDKLSQLVTEYELLRKLRHPNIVEGINLVHGLQNMYLFMEMVGTKNLFHVIRSEGEEGLPWSKAKEVLLHIFRGGAYMHDMKVAHCDLKPENIMISSDGCAKLIDFGQAIDVGEAIPELTDPRGTMPFMAPEMLRVGQTWDPIATDLWSLGVILVEVLCGNHTFAKILGWRRASTRSELEKCADELSIGFGKESKDTVLDGVVNLCLPPLCVRPMLVGLFELVPARRSSAKVMVASLEESL